ncbi:hypothetical protein GCM10020255_057720 [Rhodococcus baikonurensis]
MYCLVKEVRTLTEQSPNISAVIPAGWSNDSVAALRDALDSMDLDGVDLIPEEEASAAWLADPEAADSAARGAAALAAPFAIAPTPNPNQPTWPSRRSPRGVSTVRPDRAGAGK